MNSTRLAWEPKSPVPPEELEGIVRALTNGKGNVSILQNGTLLFVKKSADDEEYARDLVGDFSSLYNFKVVPVDIGGYLVGFHEAVAVFVTESEFRDQREKILSRLGELCFPEEKINMKANAPEDHALIGVYARGKLRRDASDFHFYKRL